MNKTGSVTVGLLFCFVFAGCSVFKHAAQTLWIEPKIFPTQKDNCRTLDRDREWAETAWQAEQAEKPEFACIPEYAQGFNEGFADYLYAGGTGEPPPVPPRRFWNLDYRTPAGHKAVEAWFAGFRRGAGAVRAGGFREQVTIKSSLCPCKTTGAYIPPPNDAEKMNPLEVIPTPMPTEPSLIEPPLPEKGRFVPLPETPLPQNGETTPPTNMPSLQKVISLQKTKMPSPQNENLAPTSEMSFLQNGNSAPRTETTALQDGKSMSRTETTYLQNGVATTRPEMPVLPSTESNSQVKRIGITRRPLSEGNSPQWSETTYLQNGEATPPTEMSLSQSAETNPQVKRIGITRRPLSD